MRKKISLMLPLLCALLAFWACGDGESNSGTSANGSVSESDLVVATFDDLPVCSGKREGATAYVKDEKTAYICEDGKWISDDETDGDDSSSSVKPGSSSSSVNPGSSSSKKDDPKSSSSFKYEQDSTAYEQPDVVKVKDKSIAGVSQKGPFVTGSAVKLYELDGETYAQTGKSFTGKITSDNGEFGVSSVTLASQYALLEASGYYRNEVSGKKSGGTITLNALTDLSDREKVNINLLTHLEYERALYLVGTGMNVPAAKKQAEAEIFNAFGIQGDFANSEDLDIFSKGEGNAALLAFSILMQGDRSEAELTELLTKFAIDIEKDGEWNDDATKAKIADWANEQDLNGRLSSIRSNINSWGLGSASDFEKYVRNFWNREYGLEECCAENKGEIAAATNELVKTYGTKTRYICKGEGWVEASDIEKVTYQWAAGEDGEIKKGDSTDVQYKYDEALDQWVATNANDVSLGLMGCTTNRTGEIGKSGENKYYCSSKGWVEITDGWSWNVPKEARLNSEIAYGTMTDTRDNKTYKTVKIGDQVWMAENLNYADSTKMPSLKGKSWCYDNKTENCDVTGRLYTWAAAIDFVALANDADNPQTCGYGETCTLPTVVQGVCPSGWHLPTYDEWQTLFKAVGGSSAADKALKSGSGCSGNGNGTDTYGFSALPAGYRINDGTFGNAGNFASFWSASEYNSYGAYLMRLYCNGGARMDHDSKNFGDSVRCLQNSN